MNRLIRALTVAAFALVAVCLPSHASHGPPGTAPLPTVDLSHAYASQPAKPVAVVQAETPGASVTLAQTESARVLKVAASQVGTMERTGNNDGPVEKYLTSVGLSRGDPYCAAFVYWCGKTALGSACPYPKSGYSPDMVAKGTAASKAQPADAFGIYFASKGRIAHTGLVEKVSGSYLQTIEGNTSSSAAVGSAADRDGEGVYRKLRPISTVKFVRRWCRT